MRKSAIARFAFLELFRQRANNSYCFWWSCDPLFMCVRCFRVLCVLPSVLYPLHAASSLLVFPSASNGSRALHAF